MSMTPDAQIEHPSEEDVVSEAEVSNVTMTMMLSLLDWEYMRVIVENYLGATRWADDSWRHSDDYTLTTRRRRLLAWRVVEMVEALGVTTAPSQGQQELPVAEDIDD